MTNNFDVEEAVDEFKKSIKCPNPQSCEIESNGEMYFSFPNNNSNTIIQSNNKHTHTTLYKKEKSNPTGNIKISILFFRNEIRVIFTT